MAGALPWAIKDYVSESVLQLAMDYVDLPTPPAGLPRINVICVPKARVQQLADAVNGIASLDAIVSDELAMTALYEPDQTVRMLLWQPKGQDLQLLVFHQGGLCFSRQLRGFGALTGEHEPDAMLLDSLALEIQRSLDYWLASSAAGTRPDAARHRLALHRYPGAPHGADLRLCRLRHGQQGDPLRCGISLGLCCCSGEDA